MLPSVSDAPAVLSPVRRGGTSVRWAALVALTVVSTVCYLRVRSTAPTLLTQPDDFFRPLLAVTVLCVLATWLVFASRSNGSPRRRQLELGLVIAAGLVFRAVFVGAPPTLSHDPYRYVWDAQLVAHGVSPYTHAVIDPALTALRDATIWPQVNWRNAPTIYPPGAQLLFLAVHVIAPLNVWAMKAAMELCDVLVAGLTLVLLRQHGLDLRRVIVYWWNPIPILEYCYTGHLDAAATLWTLSAVLVSGARWRGARFAGGGLLGLAAATKLYPALFAIVLIRRRDWQFAAGLAGTILAIYLPFLPLGVTSGGFLSTYFTQRFIDQGIVFRLITTIILITPVQLALQSVALGGLCMLTLWLRIRHRLGTPAGILAVSVAWIVISPHLFPWYVGVLLPFLALYVRLPTLSRTTVVSADLAGAYPTLTGGLWLFVLAMPFTYVIFAPAQDSNLFVWFFLIPLAVAGVPLRTRLQRLVSFRPHAQRGIPSNLERR